VIAIILRCAHLPVLAALLAVGARWLVQRRPLLVRLQCVACGARLHGGTGAVVLVALIVLIAEASA
jgi:hypothetical protein